MSKLTTELIPTKVEGNLLSAAEFEKVRTAINETNDIKSYTYAELKVLISDGKLDPGQKYKLSDYITQYLRPEPYVNHQPVVATVEKLADAVEPLILTAISVTEFDKHAVSTLFPGDDILYQFVNNDFGWNLDEGRTERKGHIMYRKGIPTLIGTDKLAPNETWFDWRNIKILNPNGQETLMLDNTYGNKIGKAIPLCYYYIGGSAIGCVIGNACNSVKIYNGQSHCTVGNECNDIIIQSGSGNNYVGPRCTNIQIINGSSFNKIASNSYNVILTSGSSFNELDNVGNTTFNASLYNKVFGLVVTPDPESDYPTPNAINGSNNNYISNVTDLNMNFGCMGNDIRESQKIMMGNGCVGNRFIASYNINFGVLGGCSNNEFVLSRNINFIGTGFANSYNKFFRCNEKGPGQVETGPTELGSASNYNTLIKTTNIKFKGSNNTFKSGLTDFNKGGADGDDVYENHNKSWAATEDDDVVIKSQIPDFYQKNVFSDYALEFEIPFSEIKGIDYIADTYPEKLLLTIASIEYLNYKYIVVGNGAVRINFETLPTLPFRVAILASDYVVYQQS